MTQTSVNSPRKEKERERIYCPVTFKSWFLMHFNFLLLLSSARRLQSGDVSPKRKDSKCAGGVSRTPAFWFSAFGSLWPDHPPFPSPISELSWEGVSCCVSAKPVFTRPQMHRGSEWVQPYHEGSVGVPLSTSVHVFPHDFWSHQNRGWLLLGTSNLVKLNKKKMNNPINKPGEIIWTKFHKERYRWTISNWTSLVKRKCKLKAWRDTTKWRQSCGATRTHTVPVGV